MRGSRRSWVRTRAAVAVAARAFTTRPLRRAAGRRRPCPPFPRGPDLGDRARGQQAAAAEEHEALAPLGLAHDVTRHQQGRPVTRQLREGAPELSPQHRIEPDGRLVEHQELGVAEERRAERDAGLLTAGEPSDDVSGQGHEVDGSEHLVDPLCRRIEDPREVAEVLANGQIPVIPTAPGSCRRRAARNEGAPPSSPRTRTVPDWMRCTPTIERISVVLPLPLGPSRPVTAPRRTVRVTSASARARPRTTTRRST